MAKIEENIKIFMGGDVCGKAGFESIQTNLPNLIKDEDIDFCVINGENTANGVGIRDDEASVFFKLGVDVITGGNHTLERFDIRNTFGKDTRILRPHNLPNALGKGVVNIKKNGINYVVINLLGRENMRPVDCPFKAIDSILEYNKISDGENSIELKNAIILVDFHAESTSEKEAMAFYADGRVSLLVGTHTHTQTTDERILPNGTAYITDIGMIGAKNSVIGGDYEASILRAKTQVPQKSDMDSIDEVIFCGIIAEININDKKAVNIKRIFR